MTPAAAAAAVAAAAVATLIVSLTYISRMLACSVKLQTIQDALICVFILPCRVNKFNQTVKSASMKYTTPQHQRL